VIAQPFHFPRSAVFILSVCRLFGVFIPGRLGAADTDSALKLNETGYFEARGLSVLVYQNFFHPVFFDQKLSGIEIIQHGERIATGGEVRLSPTPEQWDPVPAFREKKADPASNRMEVSSGYPGFGLAYRIEVRAEREGFAVAVHLDKPLPDSLAGRAGFNLEFLPTAYFGKTYILDGGFGVFPRHPNGPMQRDADGSFQPCPLAQGKSITLAPEDPLRRVEIVSDNGGLALFDGRNKAQNGWFVVRSLIPPGATHNAVVWHVRPNRVPGWIRPPVIAHSQVGYHPDQAKTAVLELDSRFDAPKTAKVLKLAEDGSYKTVFKGKIKPWGKWTRYQYAHFDFTPVSEPGLYAVEYAGRTTEPFRIQKDVYSNHVWQQTLDTYLPVQMDHVSVREGYRVWHGVSHLDDARQAPVKYVHFDGYRQGPETDSPFAPGEHIPGLDRGGWYDAGDFDIRTPTQAGAVCDLVTAIEAFGVNWDETTVDEKRRVVEIRRPDGVSDAVQQVEHGVLALLGQFKAVGHAIPGIVEPTLRQYTHLGDGASKTDNRIFSARLDSLETDGIFSGVPDDRWAFTNRSTALDYGSAAALAAASRVLKGAEDTLAVQCLQTAERVWDTEHQRPPAVFESFNTAPGNPAGEELKAAVELLAATGGEKYKNRLKELLPYIADHFIDSGWRVCRVLSFMDDDFKKAVESSLCSYKTGLDNELSKNPFGVPIMGGTWGGAHVAAAFAVHMYFLHEAFPQIVGPEYTLRGVDYVLGTHPASSVSYVSAVGTRSKTIAYGSNRADYSFIPGGMIPGIVIVRPDFPELKDDWPFLWYENEYVVGTATTFILAANAADALMKEKGPSSGP
jgi:hypothetical protein